MTNQDLIALSLCLLAIITLFVLGLRFQRARDLAENRRDAAEVGLANVDLELAKKMDCRHCMHFFEAVYEDAPKDGVTYGPEDEYPQRYVGHVCRGCGRAINKVEES